MLVALVLLAFAGLGYRLVDLQVLRHEALSVKAQENAQLEFPLEPRRGDILDAKGNLLATSVLVKTVCADPTTVGNRQTEIARILAPLLQMSEAQLVAKLTPRIYQNEDGETATNKYVKLKEKVSVDSWQRIQTAMTNLSFGLDEKKLSKSEKAFYQVLRNKAVFAEDGQLRAYPNQTLAAHVLGYVGTEERTTNGDRRIEIVGKDGIEHMFDSKLRGVRGWRVTEKDGKAHELVSRREQDVEARDGLNVVLTRSTDTLIDLASRPTFCRADCDLFVSIHVNSMPKGRRQTQVNGVETYFVSDAKTEDQKRVAQMENDALRFSTTPTLDSASAVGFILHDLQLNEYLRESARLAELVQGKVAVIHPGEDRGVQQGPFLVLAAARRPAILVETGFATNLADGAFLASAQGQRKIATAIADGIVAYLLEFERRLAVGTGGGLSR